jgi:hypothetical protein
MADEQPNRELPWRETQELHKIEPRRAPPRGERDAATWWKRATSQASARE